MDLRWEVRGHVHTPHTSPNTSSPSCPFCAVTHLTLHYTRAPYHTFTHNAVTFSQHSSTVPSHTHTHTHTHTHMHTCTHTNSYSHSHFSSLMLIITTDSLDLSKDHVVTVTTAKSPITPILQTNYAGALRRFLNAKQLLDGQVCVCVCVWVCVWVCVCVCVGVCVCGCGCGCVGVCNHSQ